MVIFITAYNEYAIKAFKFSAVDYIMKPINVEELIDALKRCEMQKEQENLSSKLKVLLKNMNSSSSESNKIVLKTQESIHVVKISFKYGEAIHVLFPDKILFYHSTDHSTTIYMTRDKSLSLDITLPEIEKILSNNEFWRTNDHYLINLRYLKNIPSGLSNQSLIMDGNHSIPVDLKRKKMLINAITNI